MSDGTLGPPLALRALLSNYIRNREAERKRNANAHEFARLDFLRLRQLSCLPRSCHDPRGLPEGCGGKRGTRMAQHLIMARTRTVPAALKTMRHAPDAPVSFLVSKLSSISTLFGSWRKICQRVLLGTWFTR
jgi:hypothetical protein